VVAGWSSPSGRPHPALRATLPTVWGGIGAARLATLPTLWGSPLLITYFDVQGVLAARPIVEATGATLPVITTR
jgi:hypothetical protein